MPKNSAENLFSVALSQDKRASIKRFGVLAAWLQDNRFWKIREGQLSRTNALAIGVIAIISGWKQFTGALEKLVASKLSNIFQLCHSTQLHFYSLFERQKMKWSAGKQKRGWPLPTFKRMATNNHTLQKTDELFSSRLPRFSGAHFPSLVSFTIICR